MKKYGYKINHVVEKERISHQDFLHHGMKNTEGREKTSQEIFPRTLENLSNREPRDERPTRTPPDDRSECNNPEINIRDLQGYRMG